MPLKFELLQADDYSRYLLREKTDILYNLRALMQRRVMLSAFIDASADSFLSAILAITADEQHLILDAASDEAINRRVEAAEKLICVTQLDKIKIQLPQRISSAFPMKGIRPSGSHSRRCCYACSDGNTIASPPPAPTT